MEYTCPRGRAANTEAGRRTRQRSMSTRVVTWNCRRAGATHAAWEYLRALAPDIALLQELTGVPEWAHSEFDLRLATPPTKGDRPQRFQSALLIRGRIGAPVTFRSRIPWVNDELERFGPNLLAHQIELEAGPRLNVACVYSPAWPVSRTRLEGLDLSGVKLTQNPDVWVSDLLVAALRDTPAGHLPWIVAGDFNACETFDSWKGGPRGNREWLDRMAALGFTECLRYSRGALTPTFRRPGKALAHCQIDHLFASAELKVHLVSCRVEPPEQIYEQGLSDHLPIVSEFDAWDVSAD
jgi:endonuclease/exonuclease/phosphatase family metal-dependent hydrolase